MNAESFFGAPRLALDTEFVWTKTYRARLGLVQAARSGGFDPTRLHATAPAAIPLPAESGPEFSGVVLVDPLAAPPAPLGKVLGDASTVKTLHDAHQDLAHLFRWTGVAPENVFDTKIAAGFCGLSCSLSLARLVEDVAGVSLPKTETRTDWCRRPLSREQLVYAAQDVAWLDAVASDLVRRCEKAGTLAWMAEEMAKFDGPEAYREEPPEAAVRHVKIRPGEIARDDRAARRRLVALAAWREETARARDLPRKWIAPDEALVAVAVDPEDPRSGRFGRPVSPRLFAEMREVARKAGSAPPDPAAEEAERAEAEKARRRREAHGKATEVLAKIAAIAEKAGVDPALVASRADATEWVLAPDDPSLPLNRGWRFELAGGKLRNRAVKGL